MAYNRYNNGKRKNKKSYKKSNKKTTSSYKKSNFSKKQYKIIKNIASKVSQNNNNVEWKQLVCDYTGDNSIKNEVGGSYNFKFKPITQLLLKYNGSTDIRVGLNGARGLFTDGFIRSGGNMPVSDVDDDTKQIINGRRINIKSIYVKGYIKYKLDVDVNTPQSAGFIIYKQKFNKDSEHFDLAGGTSSYCPDINDMYKDGVEPTTTGGVLNMKYMALTDPLKKREFIPLMKFTKTIYKTDTDMTEYNFKVSKFYKFKNGLPVKWNDKINDYIDNPTGNACIALSEINNLYFVPWFSYIPTEGDNNWEMNLKIYVNYTDC